MVAYIVRKKCCLIVKRRWFKLIRKKASSFIVQGKMPQWQDYDFDELYDNEPVEPGAFYRENSYFNDAMLTYSWGSYH